MKKYIKRLAQSFQEHLIERKWYKQFLCDIEGNESSLKLTSKQKQEIDDFYIKNYGKKIPYDYHEYFLRNGFFSPEYIPTSLYRSKIIYRLNDFNLKDAYTDKNQFSKLFPKTRQPKVILRCINGFYYDEEYNEIIRDEALLRCKNLSKAIIKPSVETSHGDRVVVFSSLDGIYNKYDKIENLLESYGNNFLIQDFVKQSEVMQSLNKTSLNTIRFLTYRNNLGKIVILYKVIRIGRNNQVVDNECAGGISAKILDNGFLNKYAYNGESSSPFIQTDSGVILENFQIPNYDKICNFVLELHTQLPYFRLAGWDIALDEYDLPVLIEWNVSPDLSQSANGPAFGDYTIEILQNINKLENSRPIIFLGKGFKK